MASRKPTSSGNVRKGDPDPTPGMGVYCGTHIGRKGLFVCTRRPHADTLHIAGSGREILAVRFDPRRRDTAK